MGMNQLEHFRAGGGCILEQMEMPARQSPFVLKARQRIGPGALVADPVSLRERMNHARPVAAGNSLANALQKGIAGINHDPSFQVPSSDRETIAKRARENRGHGSSPL